jgi:hypothetical protein
VRKARGRVRIAAQLIETESDAHLWADRFDGSLEDVFELQDQVAVSVAGVIEPTLQVAEVRRSTHHSSGRPCPCGRCAGSRVTAAVLGDAVVLFDDFVAVERQGVHQHVHHTVMRDGHMG